MAEKVYTSKGIVLQKQPFGEASISALILTKDFGLIRVRAQSARTNRAKLRASLEPMSVAVFSFVRGKEVNRLIGAEIEGRLFNDAHTDSRRAQGQVARLLLRLMPGEDVHPRLFDIVRDGFAFITTCAKEETADAECILVLSILSELGYLPEEASLHAVVAVPLSAELVMQMKTMRPQAVKTINAIISASGL